MRDTPEGIPQVLVITRVTGTGRVALKKVVREHLGGEGVPLYLQVDDEVALTQHATGRAAPVEMSSSRVALPEEVLTRLGVGGGAQLAFIQRPEAAAIKRFELIEHQGTWAQIADHETPLVLRRIAETNPPQEALLPGLAEQYQALYLEHDVRAFLKNRPTLAAWRARQLLHMDGGGDDAQREALIGERLATQGTDGSWTGEVVLTARMLRELAVLGLTHDAEETRRGAQWLLERAESQANPGMFFLSDDLVAEQSRILWERKSGHRLRFRERKQSEMRRVSVGDDLIQEPCGPRIMWPNALVLEALIALGYEGHERVQSALRTLTIQDWCECGYQHGFSDRRRTEPLTDEQLAAFEQRCMSEYRYGGIADIDELATMDLSKTVGERLYRCAHRREDGVDVYPLGMPDHLQLCEVMTTRALSGVEHAPARRFAEAHLWRFAGRQQGPRGEFTARDVQRFLNAGQTALLQVFARYDHPASQIAILRALPWIVETQNADGFWGEGEHRDAATLAVVEALVRVRALVGAARAA